jgi:hypothetical protein
MNRLGIIVVTIASLILGFSLWAARSANKMRNTLQVSTALTLRAKPSLRRYRHATSVQ